jgi:hypothetical protein
LRTGLQEARVEAEVLMAVHIVHAGRTSGVEPRLQLAGRDGIDGLGTSQAASTEAQGLGAGFDEQGGVGWRHEGQGLKG